MGHDAGDLVTVATFTGLDEAGIARGVLESEGIETFVRNEHLVAIAWTLSQATGGVSLAVAKEDAEEARELLGNDEPLRLAGGNPDDADAAGPGDLLAERAWKSALVGFLGIPFAFHAWSLLLLRQAYAAGGPLTDRGRTCARRALVVSSCMVFAWGAILVRIFSS